MAILIDILLAALLGGFCFLGWRTGLVRALIGFVGSVLALAAAVLLGRLLAGWIYAAFFQPPLVEGIRDAISGQGAAGAQQQAEGMLSALPDFLRNALANLGVTAQQIGAGIAASADPAAQSAESFVSPVVTHLIALILTLVLFAIFRTGVYYVARVVNRVFRLPLLNGLNRALGAVCGLLKGGVIVFLIMTVVLVVIPFLPTGLASATRETIDSSVLCRWFLEINPIRLWFQSGA